MPKDSLLNQQFFDYLNYIDKHYTKDNHTARPAVNNHINLDSLATNLGQQMNESYQRKHNIILPTSLKDEIKDNENTAMEDWENPNSVGKKLFDKAKTNWK